MWAAQARVWFELPVQDPNEYRGHGIGIITGTDSAPDNSPHVTGERFYSVLELTRARPIGTPHRHIPASAIRQPLLDMADEVNALIKLHREAVAEERRERERVRLQRQQAMVEAQARMRLFALGGYVWISVHTRWYYGWIVSHARTRTKVQSVKQGQVVTFNVPVECVQHDPPEDMTVERFVQSRYATAKVHKDHGRDNLMNGDSNEQSKSLSATAMPQQIGTANPAWDQCVCNRDEFIQKRDEQQRQAADEAKRRADELAQQHEQQMRSLERMNETIRKYNAEQDAKAEHERKLREQRAAVNRAAQQRSDRELAESKRADYMRVQSTKVPVPNTIHPHHPSIHKLTAAQLLTGVFPK